MANGEGVSEIKITKSYNVEKEGLYLIIFILSFFMVFIVLLVFGLFYLIEPDVLFSPPTVGLFVMGLNDSYVAIIGDEISENERNLINDFVLEFGELKIFKEQERVSEEKLLVIGLIDDFIDVYYLEYLKDNDSIVIYDSEKDSLYVFARDLNKLGEVMNILKNDSENLEYFSIKINQGVVEELVV
ncbi:hypothetical protein HOE04_01200 [archaeon]|jgi:hypothetical protein|nr:hypothetical protein [archaeon]